MRFLLDTKGSNIAQRLAEFPDFVLGQLRTPLTCYADWGGVFAIDNGAYSGLDIDGYLRLLNKAKPYKDRCLFVAVPDIVGNARRTLELFRQFPTKHYAALDCWRSYFALVAQDGVEDFDIDWSTLPCIFIGGTNKFKDSEIAYDLVRTAKSMGVHVHVGRVNTVPRFEMYNQLGADTCDGSGVSMYTHMLEDIVAGVSRTTEAGLFDEIGGNE